MRPANMNLEERKAILARRVSREVASGARVSSQTDTSALITRYRDSPPFVLGLLLFLITLGQFAFPVRVEVVTLTVDENGLVHETDVKDLTHPS